MANKDTQYFLFWQPATLTFPVLGGESWIRVIIACEQFLRARRGRNTDLLLELGCCLSQFPRY